VSLLDGFSLTHDGRDLPLPLAGQRLIAFLALHPRPVLRPFAAGTLWPDSTEEHAAASLRTALWKLRGLGLPVVQATQDHLWLGGRLATDLADAVALARRVLASGGDPPEPIEAGSQLKADLLPDWYDEWLVIEREQFRQLRLHALETLCLRLTAAGRHAAAVDLGLAAVSADPLRESSRRALIAAHLAEGNLHEAVAQYRTFRQLLFDELHASPSPDMERLLPTERAGLGGRRR
jgi:DNA-binding SARP family transcriptional activator